MRRIAHLSDIHFGRVDEQVVARAVEKINELEPDLVVVSGDLTQRARTREFAAARDFLDSLPKPQLVVPGNHDVPLYNVFDRFARPLEKFQRFICTRCALLGGHGPRTGEGDKKRRLRLELHRQLRRESRITETDFNKQR